MLATVVRAGDVVLIQGAGDIGDLVNTVSAAYGFRVA